MNTADYECPSSTRDRRSVTIANAPARNNRTQNRRRKSSSKVDGVHNRRSRRY